MVRYHVSLEDGTGSYVESNLDLAAFGAKISIEGLIVNGAWVPGSRVKTLRSAPEAVYETAQVIER